MSDEKQDLKESLYGVRHLLETAQDVVVEARSVLDNTDDYVHKFPIQEETWDALEAIREAIFAVLYQEYEIDHQERLKDE